MNTPSNMALSFPMRVIKKNQLRSGIWQVQIEVQPEDMPVDFLTAAPESEWTIATVRQNENGEPIPASQPQDKKARKTLWTMEPVQQSVLLCKRPDFQDWLSTTFRVSAGDETGAKEFLYRRFDITSRSQLPGNQQWPQFVSKFRSWHEEQRYGDNLR